MLQKQVLGFNRNNSELFMLFYEDQWRNEGAVGSCPRRRPEGAPESCQKIFYLCRQGPACMGIGERQNHA